MEVEYTSIDNYTGWVYGLIYKRKETYEFQAKIMEEPSKYGIKKGRVTKLWIFPKGDRSPDTWIVNYDRSWDVKPGLGLLSMYKTLMQELEAFEFPH